MVTNKNEDETRSVEQEIALFKQSLAMLNEQLQEVTPGSTMEESLLERKRNIEGYIQALLQQEIEQEKANKAAVDAALDAYEASATKSEASATKGLHGFQYYQDLRRKDGGTYYSARVQNEMANARAQLGDSFYTKKD